MLTRLLTNAIDDPVGKEDDFMHDDMVNADIELAPEELAEHERQTRRH